MDPRLARQPNGKNKSLPIDATAIHGLFTKIGISLSPSENKGRLTSYSQPGGGVAHGFL